MPPTDLEADYDDEPTRSTVRFPAGVRIAGVIWIVLGALGLTAILIAISFLFIAGGQGPVPDFCAPGCVVTISLISLISGVQTVRGTSASLGGNAVGSICFGLFFFFVMVSVFVGGVFPGRELTALVLVGSLYSAVALALIAAGVLGLRGKSAYEAWREATGRNRSRQRAPEEEDYDDRPQRPDRDLPT